jgi:hypothetical protein
MGPRRGRLHYSTEALELIRQLRDWDLSNIHTRSASRAKSKEGHVYRAPLLLKQIRSLGDLMMCGLFVQRQIDVMVRLGNRADAANDCLPMLAFVIAVKDIAIGRAGK